MNERRARHGNWRRGYNASQTVIPPFPPFDPNSGPTSLSTRWRSVMIQQFQNFLVVTNINDQHRKRAMLLRCAGEAVFDIYETPSDTGDANTYDKVIEKLAG